MRPFALLAAALVLVACDSTEYVPPTPASAEAVTLVGLDTQHDRLGLVFDYVGQTPSPCHAYAGYGTSTSSTEPGRVEVSVDVRDTSEGACVGVLGQVEERLFVGIPGPGVYVVAFERVGAAPLEVRVRATLEAAIEDEAQTED